MGALSVMTYRCRYQHIDTNKPKTSDSEMMINGVSIYFPASTVRQKTQFFHLMDYKTIENVVGGSIPLLTILWRLDLHKNRSLKASTLLVTKSDSSSEL